MDRCWAAAGGRGCSREEARRDLEVIHLPDIDWRMERFSVVTSLCIRTHIPPVTIWWKLGMMVLKLLVVIPLKGIMPIMKKIGCINEESGSYRAQRFCWVLIWAVLLSCAFAWIILIQGCLRYKAFYAEELAVALLVTFMEVFAYCQQAGKGKHGALTVVFTGMWLFQTMVFALASFCIDLVSLLQAQGKICTGGFLPLLIVKVVFSGIDVAWGLFQLSVNCLPSGRNSSEEDESMSGVDSYLGYPSPNVTQVGHLPGDQRQGHQAPLDAHGRFGWKS